MWYKRLNRLYCFNGWLYFFNTNYYNEDLSTFGFLSTNYLSNPNASVWVSYYKVYMLVSSVMLFFTFVIICFLYLFPMYHSNISMHRRPKNFYLMGSEQANINLRFGRDLRKASLYYYSFKIYKYLRTVPANFFLKLELSTFTTYYYSVLFFLDFFFLWVTKIKLFSNLLFRSLFYDYYNFLSLFYFFVRIIIFGFCYSIFRVLILFYRFCLLSNIIGYNIKYIYDIIAAISVFFIFIFLRSIYGILNFFFFILFKLKLYGKTFYLYPSINASISINPVRLVINFKFWVFFVPTSVILILILPSIFALYYEYETYNISYILNNFVYAPYQDPLYVLVTGQQWFWNFDLIYNSKNTIIISHMQMEPMLKFGQPRLLTVDNPLIIPKDTWIRFYITSIDVIHSFALPNFFLKVDAIPGRIFEVWFKSVVSGIFYGQCSEICGINHAFMPICVVVV